MRFVLTIWLAIGMAPGLGEIAESMVHYVTAGRLAHSDADHGDLDDQGTEHGCGTTQHTCGCCASQVVAATPPAAAATPLFVGVGWIPGASALSSLHDPAPPTRPPILSA